MDPAFQPINGISLERYAELGAAISDVQGNAAKEAEVVQGEGVSAGDWEAAKAGWTARMQDMALMGKVAMAYMPLYQAALAARKGGAARVSYEDFVHVSAAIQCVGFEAAMAACGLSQSDWTEAAGHWNGEMARDMGRYAGHHGYVSQEAGKLRQPGASPRTIQVTRVQVAQGAGAGATAAAAGQGNPYAAAMGAGAMASTGNPMQDAMNAAMANPYAQQSMAAQAAVMANPLGHGLSQAAAYLGGGIVAGTRVNVVWSDGNHYPANVMQVTPGQLLVQFENGAQHWVGEAYVKKA